MTAQTGLDIGHVLGPEPRFPSPLATVMLCPLAQAPLGTDRRGLLALRGRVRSPLALRAVDALVCVPFPASGIALQRAGADEPPGGRSHVGLPSGGGWTIQPSVGDGLEVAVAVFVGLEVHRAQITFDAL